MTDPVLPELPVPPELPVLPVLPDETPAAEVVDWRLLDGVAIYDRLSRRQKGARLGHQANRVIREMKRRGHFTEEDSSTLAKSKNARLQQRNNFASLTDLGLEELRTLMQDFAIVEEDENLASSLDVHDISKNLRARALSLANDPRAIQYLEWIFGGVKKKARRAELDDKSTRIANHLYA